MSVDNKFQVKNQSKLASDLYPNYRDEKQLNELMEKGLVHVKKTKYNFRKMQQEKAKKQGRGTGIQKHLQQKIDEGEAENMAEAAQLQNT